MVAMRRILTMILAATVCVACMEASIDEVTNLSASDTRIYASIAPTEDDEHTRVELNERLQTVWTENDVIFTFNNGHCCSWIFEGKTGDRSGSFRQTGTYNPASEDINFDKYYAVTDLGTTLYPTYYNIDFSPAFLLTLPAVQSYKKNSYGFNTNILLGSSEDGTNYSFKNVNGYLRLSLTGDKAVQSITIKGNLDETLAGIFAANKEAMFTQWYTDVYNNITLDCGDGVQLTDEPTHFYIVMPTGTLEYGISLTINFTDGTVFPKSTSKPITITRNTIQPMATFDTGSDTEWQTITIKHHGTNLSAPYFGGKTSMSGIVYWGDGSMTDIYSAQSYVYNDGLEEHTIVVKGQNISLFYINNCEGVSEIDFSKF